MGGLDDLAGLRVLERVVSLGSLTAAAQELGLSLAATSKRLAALERRSGVQLVQRSTRKLSVTQEGKLIYLHAQRILAELGRAEEALRTQQSQIGGLLRITAPNSFGQRQLLPLLADFSRRYPGIRLQLNFSDEVKDLITDGLDLAIRYGVLPDSRLVARRLLDNQRILCAAPGYLARHGTPASLAELAQHSCILIGQHAETEWRFDSGRVHVSGQWVCNDGEASHALALQGLGIVLKSYWDVAADLAAGRLVQLLPAQAVMDAPISLVYLRNPELAPRIRVLIDYLFESFPGAG